MSEDLDTYNLLEYHYNNPQIYEAFESLTLETIRMGHQNYGAKGIFEIIRWRTPVRANEDGFKISNQYTPLYSRLFELHHPTYKDFFRKKKSKFDDIMMKEPINLIEVKVFDQTIRKEKYLEFLAVGNDRYLLLASDKFITRLYLMYFKKKSKKDVEKFISEKRLVVKKLRFIKNLGNSQVNEWNCTK